MNNVLIFLLFIALAWGCKQPSSQQDKESVPEKKFLELSQNVVNQSQAAILTHLSQAMQQKGIIGAIEYCNANVSSIIDSISRANHCKIRRTSLKLRNSANAPLNDDEVLMLQQFYQNHQQNLYSEGHLVNKDNKWIYYKPIYIIMETCLKCHGTPKRDIPDEVYHRILQLYPNDQATGYQLNDFRGMWIVEFEN